MRASKISLCILLLVICLPHWAPCLEVQDDCDADKVEKLQQNTPLHPKTIYDSQKRLMEENQWLEVVQNIKDGFIISPVPHDLNYSRYLDELQKMKNEFAHVMTNPELIAAAKGITTTRFQIKKDDEEDRIFLFPRQPDQITIDQTMKPEVRKEYCWRTIAINKMLTRYGEAGRDTVAQTLRSYVSQWDAYNANGYLQYPWELYLNGLTFDRNELAPPRHQWVIAHPGVGIEQAGQSFEKSRLNEVVTVEPLGFLWYTENRKSYYGVSTLLTLSSKQDTGRGLLLHFGKLAKLGFVWRDRDEQGRTQNGLVFSMDLYQMLSKPTQVQLDIENRVKNLYESYARQGASGGQ